jgi:hypothetical protein
MENHMHFNRDNNRLLNESISNVLFNKTEETLLNEEIDVILEQYLSEEHITEQVETYLDQFSEEEIQLICEAYENNDEEIIDALHEGFLGDIAREAGTRIKDKAKSLYKSAKGAVKSGVENLEVGKEKLKRGLAARSEFVRTAMEKGAMRRAQAARDTKEKKGIVAGLTRNIDLTRKGNIARTETDVNMIKGKAARGSKDAKKVLAQAKQSSKKGTIDSKGKKAANQSEFSRMGDIAKGDTRKAKERLTREKGTGAKGLARRIMGTKK